MKRNLANLLACVFLALAGCGKSGDTTTTTPLEADPAVFERTCSRINALIASQDYTQARTTLDTFKNYKLTDEQKKVVDQLEAKIPKTP